MLSDKLFNLLNADFYFFFHKFSTPVSIAFDPSLTKCLRQNQNTFFIVESVSLSSVPHHAFTLVRRAGVRSTDGSRPFPSLTRSLSVLTRVRPQTSGQSTPCVKGCTWSHVAGRNSRAAPRREPARRRQPSRCTGRHPVPGVERQ